MGLTSSLVLIAAHTAVKLWLEGRAPTADDITDLKISVVDALVDQTSHIIVGDARPAPNAVTTHHSANADAATPGVAIDIWGRRYNQHMIAGHRFLLDAQVEWRTPEHKDDLIADARRTFSNASAIAQDADDLLRFVQAEAAVAGSWLALESLPDVQRTLQIASEHVQHVTADDSEADIDAWAEIRTLCRAYNVPFPETDKGMNMLAHRLVCAIERIFREDG